MDPGCTNPFIDGLFGAMAPYIDGGKLAGAGGGGFAIVVARDAGAAQALSAMLAREYPGTPTSIWPSAIPAEGMVGLPVVEQERRGP
jgi:fucokinase